MKDHRSDCVKAWLIGASFAALNLPTVGWAATVSPSVEQDPLSLSAILDATPDTQLPFFWSPQTGFTHSPAAPPAGLQDDGIQRPVLLGFAFSPDEASGLRWDPTLGLVPENAATPTTGAPWKADANASKAVIWKPEDTARLEAAVFPDSSARIARVIGVAPGGLVLGEIVTEEDDARFFVWQAGRKASFLKARSDTSLVSLRAISSSGLMIGQVETVAGQKYATLISAEAEPTMLPGVDDNDSRAIGLNSNGDVVGMSEGDMPQAVLWPASGGGPIILNEVLENTLPSGLILVRADAINDAGTIIAEAVDAEGGMHMVRLTPDPNEPGRYIAIVLGHILTDATNLPDSTLALSETGSVIGTCGTLAPDCPRPFDITALDPSITNLAPFSTQAPGFLPLISNRILRGDGIAGDTPATALLETPASTTGPAPTPTTAPFGPTTAFPGVTGGGGGAEVATSAPSTAPIPLPAAFWLLASALMGVLGAQCVRTRE